MGRRSQWGSSHPLQATFLPTDIRTRPWSQAASAQILAATFCLGDPGCITLPLRARKGALNGKGLASVLVLLPEALL